MLDGVGAGVYVHTGGTWVYGNTNGVVDETAPWDPPLLVGQVDPDPHSRPARHTFQNPDLPPGMLVQCEVIAFVGDR